MEFGLKGTSRLAADVTGSRHSGLGFTVFWLFMAALSCTLPTTEIIKLYSHLLATASFTYITHIHTVYTVNCSTTGRLIRQIFELLPHAVWLHNKVKLCRLQVYNYRYYFTCSLNVVAPGYAATKWPVGNCWSKAFYTPYTTIPVPFLLPYQQHWSTEKVNKQHGAGIAHQLFPDPETSVISCRWSNTSRSGLFMTCDTTPSSMSTSTASTFP